VGKEGLEENIDDRGEIGVMERVSWDEEGGGGVIGKEGD
jgi:hypothetical protein